MAVAFAQSSGLSNIPTIRPLVTMTRGLVLWDLNRPMGWPLIITRVCSSVSSSRYLLMSWYCIQFWHTWPVSPYVTSS